VVPSGASAAPSSSAAAAASSSSSSPSSTSLSSVPRPPLSFYSSLESFLESNLKKLGELLHDQTVRLNLSGNGPAAEEPFRFLYFNHMNLALKTSLSSSAPSSKGAPPPGSLLTLETIKLIREMHKDFNTAAFRSQSLAASPEFERGPAQTRGAHEAHAIREEGSTEVCVKTRNHGWVVGRRATQSHREFFMLMEDKVASLAEVQGRTEKKEKKERGRERTRSCAAQTEGKDSWLVRWCATE
jgi:hypothetical protein